MFHVQNVKWIFLSLVLLIGLACSAQSGGIDNDKSCKVTFSTLEGLPSQVLVGTDIADLSSFKKSTSVLQKKYSAEMGGATLTLEIFQTDTGRALKRTYQEPGMQARVREYTPVCIRKGHLSAEHMKGILVDGGLLILEEQADGYGIPDNLWIFYKGD